MKDLKDFDVIIVGGSYSGLAAGMALGRALRRVLIIDSGKPCNRQTPHSHNFITQDGKPQKKSQHWQNSKLKNTIRYLFLMLWQRTELKPKKDLKFRHASGETFVAKKIIFATGIKDIMADIDGYADCWGISVLHCPYCHGYEVRNERTGILGNGEYGFEFACLISNWTKDLTLFTNGKSTLTTEQAAKLESHHIKIVETGIEKFEHSNGYLQHIIFKDGTKFPVKALYASSPFEQHCTIPATLGCELNDDGYIKTDAFQKTTVPGIYACGDNTTRLRTVANAVAMGTTAGNDGKQGNYL